MNELIRRRLQSGATTRGTLTRWKIEGMSSTAQGCGKEPCAFERSNIQFCATKQCHSVEVIFPDLQPLRSAAVDTVVIWSMWWVRLAVEI